MPSLNMRRTLLLGASIGVLVSAAVMLTGALWGGPPHASRGPLALQQATGSRSITTRTPGGGGEP
jgi:hypothetical protein